jgi:hypothetical protein
VKISGMDWVAVAAYFGVHPGVGIYYCRKTSGSIDDFLDSVRDAVRRLTGRTPAAAASFARR